MSWQATEFWHRPLYFDDVPLERYGQMHHPLIQPWLSGVHFFGNVPLLPYKMGVLKKGVHKLNGDEALAFVRDRSGTDDFQRMQQGQVFAKALIKNLANPLKWPRLPFFLMALTDVVDTDIPVWEWPRLGFAMLRAVLGGNYHSSTVPRKMTSSWVTPDGAMVLLPDWSQIIPHAFKALGY